MAGSAALIPPGWLLGGRYRLEDCIAGGGMGEVWRATDLVLERPVAVKLLHPGYAEHQEGLARFRAEARHTGSLSHPGIVQVYDYGEADPPYPPYLVMELVDGPSLARLLDEGPLGLARTMGLLTQAAMALQAAHAAGLVHRDIKPGNLLVSRGEQVKITDFGIARLAGSAPVTRPGMLVGTAAYLAPERAAGAPATPAADLYSLGIVAYQCLTGRLPFDGESVAVALAHQERPLPPLPPSVPSGVAALVADLTAKDPRARPASAWEVATRAENWRAALTATASLHRGKSNRRVPAGRSARVAVAAAAIAAITAAGWVVAGAGGPSSAHLQSGQPSATQQPSHRASHPARRVAPAQRTGSGNATHAPGQSRRSTAPRRTPAPSATPAPTRTPTPTGSPTPAPTGTSAPTATSTLIGTPTPTPTGTPAPTGTATPKPTAR